MPEERPSNESGEDEKSMGGRPGVGPRKGRLSHREDERKRVVMLFCCVVSLQNEEHAQTPHGRRAARGPKVQMLLRLHGRQGGSSALKKFP